LAKRIKIRDSFVAYGRLEGIIKNAKKYHIKCAYICTTCNKTFFGNSKALKQLLKYAKVISPNLNCFMIFTVHQSEYQTNSIAMMI